MNKQYTTFTINSKKFNGETDKSWNANLIKKNDSLMIFEGIFEKEIFHQHLGLIRRGTISREYYWTNCWFNVFKFYEPEGRFRNYYCNINKPPVISNNVLNYIDLDIDVVVDKNLTYKILDLDEYEENSLKFKYSSKLKSKINESLQRLLHLVKTKSFPFD